MIKNKTPLIFAAVFLSFCLNNIVFAVEDVTLQNKYPDYAYEFCGKDTCEKFNRKLFIFNLKLNKYVLRPVNTVWASIMPKYGMDRFQSMYNNLNYPVRLMGCLLQKDFKSSGKETVRFLTNTTIGLAGLYDPAKSKFKIEPVNEDIEQALAYHKIKKGPYLVLPVVRGSVRDLAGQLLDCAFRPFSYIPIAGGIANAAFLINNTTYMQPVIKKLEENYADPYEIVKQVDGVEKYIKISNLDRREVFMEKIASQNIIKISNITENPNLKPDMKLNDFNPQTPLIDSMRTALFDNQKTGKSSIWSEMSVWNRNFSKKFKIASVNIDPKCVNYRYRYILQKNKISPVAIIYPSIGEGIMADKSTIMAKILYDEGYSVVIEGSPCNWEFVKSMPAGYRPGAPAEDARYLRIVTSKILDNLQKKKGCYFDKKILVGCSFGGLTALFTAAQEEDENTLNISRYIAINPPVEVLFALKQVDKYSQDWKNDQADIKLRAAITAEKVLQAVQNISCNKKAENQCEPLPFTDDEAKLIVGFIMKQKLSDVIFAIENGSRSKKCSLYETINKMSFYDYSQKYLLVNNKSLDQFDYETGLHSVANFLQKSDKYKIYHSLDDYFVNTEHLVWLKKQSGDKAFYFSNGSHLGFMYRKEFVDEFKKEIKLVNAEEKNEKEMEKEVHVHKKL